MNEDPLPGVYRTTSWLSALLLLVLLQTLDFRVIAGFVLGVGIGVGLLRILQWSVRTAFRPDATKRQQALVAATTVLKYGIVGFVFWFTISRQLINVYSLCGGFLVPQTVIFLQAVSEVITQRGGREVLRSASDDGTTV